LNRAGALIRLAGRFEAASGALPRFSAYLRDPIRVKSGSPQFRGQHRNSSGWLVSSRDQATENANAVYIPDRILAAAAAATND